MIESSHFLPIFQPAAEQSKAGSQASEFKPTRTSPRGGALGSAYADNGAGKAGTSKAAGAGGFGGGGGGGYASTSGPGAGGFGGGGGPGRVQVPEWRAGWTVSGGWW